MRLTACNVKRVFSRCLIQNEEVVKGKRNGEAIMVEGLYYNYLFSKERVGENKEAICQLIDQLPGSLDEGMSIIFFRNDKNGKSWSETVSDGEILMVLGIAAGILEYCYPKELWKDKYLLGTPDIRRK